jgi:hypothetical protein
VEHVESAFLKISNETCLVIAIELSICELPGANKDEYSDFSLLAAKSR